MLRDPQANVDFALSHDDDWLGLLGNPDGDGEWRLAFSPSMERSSRIDICEISVAVYDDRVEETKPINEFVSQRNGKYLLLCIPLIWKSKQMN